MPEMMSETMHDRGIFWAPAPDMAKAEIERDDLSAVFVTGLHQTLISGELDVAMAAIAPHAYEVGLGGDSKANAAVWVRIARDRALLVSSQPLDIVAGWRDGYVVTPCDDAWAVLDLSGLALYDVIAEAMSADIDAGSRSAAVLFADIPVLLYRTSLSSIRLHVERPLAAYLWRWLEDRK